MSRTQKKTGYGWRAVVPKSEVSLMNHARSKRREARQGGQEEPVQKEHMRKGWSRGR